MTQEEVGKILGVTQDTVSAWEVGKKYPRRRNMAAIKKLYGKTEAELFGERDEER